MISVEESKTTETSMEVVEGMQFDRGSISPYFVTDPEKMEAVLSTVLRDGAEWQVPSAELVPGDVVLLSAGRLVPADGVVLEARDFHVTQAALTGESDAVEKTVGAVAADAAVAARTNAVFMGTSERSGTARVLIVRTGDATLYGAIAERLRLRPPETEFARGLRRYGYLLTRVMLIMVLIVFAASAANVGISIDKAVDVAREAADFVLLEHDLDVLLAGVEEGRRTFANTLKYIAITTSANLGNMISMAIASVFLPCLPLLAKQILLNNFLSDFPGIAIAGDNIDPETMAAPRHWDMARVLNIMLVFGLVSSAFDILTFAVLLGPFAADPALFRTGWFVESLLTELVIVFVIRTWRPAWSSRPGRLLVASAVVVIALTLAIPYLPGAALMCFVALPATLLGALLSPHRSSPSTASCDH